jgi:hypothetical protein
MTTKPGPYLATASDTNWDASASADDMITLASVSYLYFSTSNAALSAIYSATCFCSILCMKSDENLKSMIATSSRMISNSSALF